MKPVGANKGKNGYDRWSQSRRMRSDGYKEEMAEKRRTPPMFQYAREVQHFRRSVKVSRNLKDGLNRWGPHCWTGSFGAHYTKDTGLARKTFFTGSKRFKVKEIEVFEIHDSIIPTTSLSPNFFTKKDPDCLMFDVNDRKGMI
jgi:hypothetical protein